MKPKQIDKGEQFEATVGAYFQNDRYFIRTSVPFRVSPVSQPITDIDVLGIKFTSSFAVHKIICDCKDKARPKAFARILWTKGLGEFLKVSESFVSVTKTTLEVVKFGRMAGVHVLSDDALQAAKISTSRGIPYGVVNKIRFAEINAAVQAGLKTERIALDLLNASRFLILSDDAYVAFNDAFYYLTEAAGYLKITPENRRSEWACWRYVTAEVLVILTLQLLLIAADTVSLTADDRRVYIKERLTYGNLAPDKARELFELATELAFQMHGQSPDSRAVSREELRSSIDVPAYADAVVGLVDRSLAQPGLYCELLQTIDFLLFQQSLPSGEFNEAEFCEVFGADRVAERLKIARNVFVFARDSAGLQLRHFWPKHAQNLPSLDTEHRSDARSKDDYRPSESFESVSPIEVASKSDSERDADHEDGAETQLPGL